MDASPIPEPGNFLLPLFLYFLLLLGAAFFASSESALSSVNRIRIKTRAEDGDKRAEKVQYILDHFDDALSAILVGNNIMHIGCASFATVTATRLWGQGAVAIATVVTTLIVFFLAEMIPKTFARACSEQFSLFCAPVLRLLMRFLTPIGRFFGNIRRLIMKNAPSSPTVTEEELHDIIDNIGTEENGVDEDTAELVQSALEFTETPAGEIFTPWEKVLCVSTAMSPKKIADVIESCPHSRLPVINGSGEVIGLLQIRKYLKEYIRRHGHVSLKLVMDRPYFVPTGLPIDTLLESMSQSKTHAAVVRSDSGEPVGLLTVEDILEELVGEIYDEEETAAAEEVKEGDR